MKDYSDNIIGQYEGRYDKNDFSSVRLNEKPPKVFRPFLTVDVDSGNILLKRDPEPVQGNDFDCMKWMEENQWL